MKSPLNTEHKTVDAGRLFLGKRVLITGGTGSFGAYVLNALIQFDPREIIVFSRDEDKQHQLRLNYTKAKNLKCVIGDVRDLERVREATKNIDIVFNAAALKQVPYCEEYPHEAVLTNIVGARNLRIASIENNVEKVIGISTDKAVKPVNVMGMTKALQERIFTSVSTDATKFACVRYGNVIGSRGSVMHLFYKKILAGEKVPITDRSMTRFLITLKQAINLVFLAVQSMRGGEIFVMKSPSCHVMHLGKVLYRTLNPDKFRPSYYTVTGVRPGEKLHEILISEEEGRGRVQDNRDHFVVHPYWRKTKFGAITEYCSNPPTISNDKELEDVLRGADNLPWVKPS